MQLAGVMLIIKDGKILGISRRNNKNVYGLLGGKFNPEPPDSDKDTKDTAIRETKEESGVIVKDCILIYQQVEPGEVDYLSYCYYALDWSGEIQSSEEGEVAWLTEKELTLTKAAFGQYNQRAFEAFKKMFPDVEIIFE